MFSKSSILLCSVFTLIIFLQKSRASPIKDDTVEFIILHNNDMHARFDQTSAKSGKCTQELLNTNKCYGGFARVAYEVRKYRWEAQNGGLPVVYLNAGDTYSGTPWYTIFKDKIAADFLNELQPDAISLGNHELDDNVAGLLPFLNEIDFPVLTCNLDLTKEPELAGARNFYNSTLLNVNGVNIGVVGYLTPETKNLTKPNEIVFLDEIEAINKEAARLKDQGINILIALGHSGYEKDQEIAMNCPEIDLVIGGHTNTFLYNGDQPDDERIEGPYPTKVTQESGKIVPVVQAYAYTKYLGKLHVQFDHLGNLIEFDGTPILLNADVPREPDVVQLVEKYRPNITAFETKVVGYTKVFLDGRREICRSQECTIGNLIADAMITARVLEYYSESYWSDAPIAFLNAGSIRSSIDKRPDGKIFASDILNVQPFGNDLYMSKISGAAILKNLEHSASMEPTDDNPSFLQMSGIRAIFDYSRPVGNRVTSVFVRRCEINVPSYEPMDLNQVYNVIVPEFILEGGDGYMFVEDNGHTPQRLQKTDYETILQYLQQRTFVYPEIEGRLIIVGRN